METRDVATNAVEFLLLAVIISVVAGQFLGQPVLLGYVETGSMSPTLEPGDGFIAVPSALTTIQTGDIVTFRSGKIQGGRLVTHRIVGKTQHGYITKGDANAFTDQDNKEPPVKRAQIVAEAFQVGSNVIVIPELGTLVMGVKGLINEVQRRLAILLGTRALLGVQGLAYIFFALTVVWYAVGEWRAKKEKRRERERERDTGTDTRVVVAVLAILVVAAATASMALPAG
ncbi:MAG: signal peptidase I, partial [Halobacteria archaeon]|nr:signal peptidase I [Halobacteria archaeon]